MRCEPRSSVDGTPGWGSGHVQTPVGEAGPVGVWHGLALFPVGVRPLALVGGRRHDAAGLATVVRFDLTDAFASPGRRAPVPAAQLPAGQRLSGGDAASVQLASFLTDGGSVAGRL